MKKKLICVACALSLVAAFMVPTAAFADSMVPSPSGDPIVAISATSSTGISISAESAEHFPAESLENKQLILVESTTQNASNTPADATVLASFRAYTNPENWMDEIYLFNYNLTLWGIADQYEGQTVTLYIEHHNGATEAQSAVVKNGEIQLNSSLSYFTLVLGGTGGKNTGSISPKTGYQLGIPLALGCAAVIIGGAVLFSMRRKKSE